MAMVGKTESIYRRYAIADQVMMREGAEKLAALHQSERGCDSIHQPVLLHLL
jgi:hypothetical protein